MGGFLENFEASSKGLKKRLAPKESKDKEGAGTFLDLRLKELSFEPRRIKIVLVLAESMKKLEPKMYQRAFRNRVADYSNNLYMKAVSEWEVSEQKLPDYREHMKILFLLASFEPLIDKKTDTTFIAEITKLEAEMKKHIKAHPEELNKFLKDADSEAFDRSMIFSKLEQREEKILELLTFASTKVDKVEKKDETDSYTIMHDGEIWEFHVFKLPSAFMGGTSSITVKSRKTPEKLITMSFRKIIEFLEEDNFAEVVSMVDNNYESEKKYADLLAGFDLPKSEGIEYLRLSLDKFDPVITPTFFGSTVFAESLGQFYPNLHVATPILTSKPKEDLMARVRESYTKGTRQFFIDIYAHGSKEKLAIGDGLEAGDLIAIAKEFPDANFYFSTMGCFGGGLREGFLQAMEKEPELKQRVSLFLQTKPDVINIIQGRVLERVDGELTKAATGELTIYQMALLKALSKGKTFGEAIIAADKEAKIKMYMDPETIIGGQLITELEKEEIDKAA